MDVQAIGKYICEKKRVAMPVLQEQFILTYSDTVKALSELEKRGKIKYCDGLIYEWNTQGEEKLASSKIYLPKNEQEAMFIKALWECIRNGSVSTSVIQSKCSVGYVVAARAIDWMEINGFVSPTNGPMPRVVLMSEGDFIKKFGHPGTDILTEKNEMENMIEEHHRSFLERLHRIAEGDEDENGNEDDEEDNYDEDDDDMDKAAQERREYLEKRRQEIIERLRQSQEDEDHDEIVADLHAEIQRMPCYNADDDTFSIKMEVKYPDGMPFRVKVIEHDGCFYVSDCGDTLKYLSLYNDKDLLAEYFRDAFKTDNMCFIEDAVCTTVDDIHDLSGEASFLFKVVNGLITQKHFDIYYLGDNLLMLADSILKENDAAMLVNALSVLDEKPIQVSVLQKKLHIEQACANGLINTLTKLGVLLPDGVKTDIISDGFIVYLKRMLDNKNGE